MWIKLGTMSVNVSLGQTSSVVWLDPTTSIPTTLDGVAGLALANDRVALARSLERLHKLTTQEPRPLSKLRLAERLVLARSKPHAREPRPGKRPTRRQVER